MKLKDCPGCKTCSTTKNSKFIGRTDMGLFFNCLSCGSTFLLRSLNYRKKLVERNQKLLGKNYNKKAIKIISSKNKTESENHQDAVKIIEDLVLEE